MMQQKCDIPKFLQTGCIKKVWEMKYPGPINNHGTYRVKEMEEQWGLLNELLLF